MSPLEMEETEMKAAEGHRVSIQLPAHKIPTDSHESKDQDTPSSENLSFPVEKKSNESVNNVIHTQVRYSTNSPKRDIPI